MSDRAWVGAVALVLATGVALAIVVIAVGSAWHTGPVSEVESNLLSTVLGAAVGAIAAYLGTRMATTGGGSSGGGDGGGGAAGGGVTDE